MDMKTIMFSDLPKDMQQLIFDLVDRHDLDNRCLNIYNMPVSCFPVLEYERRGNTHAFWDYVEPMRQGLTPPLVVLGRLWLDGCHRLWAARYLKQITVEVIDLANLGILSEVIHCEDIIASLEIK